MPMSLVLAPPPGARSQAITVTVTVTVLVRGISTQVAAPPDLKPEGLGIKVYGTSPPPGQSLSCPGPLSVSTPLRHPQHLPSSSKALHWR